MKEDIWEKNGGVFFGYGCKKGEGDPPPLDHEYRYVGDRHLMTLGPNGSGKSMRLLYPNLRQLTDWSVVVIDPKGDLAQKTAKERGAEGRVIKLNPFNVLDLGSDGYNPVAALDPDSDDFPDDALGLAEAIIRVEGNEPHWSQSAQELVAALIMYVRLVVKDGSLGDVRALLGQDAGALRDMVVSQTIEYRGEPMFGMRKAAEWFEIDELLTKCGRFADLDTDNKELMGIVSNALTQTRWLDSKPVKTDLSKVPAKPIDFAALKETPTTTYLILPARRLATHSTWLRLMVTSILQPLMKDTTPAKVPVLIMLDEFAQLGHMTMIEQNMAMMRGYGIKLWTVFQDLIQAQDIYKQRWESFVANSGMLQSFAPQDVTTAKFLSDLSGQTTRHPLSATDVQSSTPKFSVGETDVPLVLPQTLRRMDDGFSYMLSHKAKGPLFSYLPFPETD